MGKGREPGKGSGECQGQGCGRGGILNNTSRRGSTEKMTLEQSLAGEGMSRGLRQWFWEEGAA